MNLRTKINCYACRYHIALLRLGSNIASNNKWKDANVKSHEHNITIFMKMCGGGMSSYKGTRASLGGVGKALKIRPGVGRGTLASWWDCCQSSAPVSGWVCVTRQDKCMAFGSSLPLCAALPFSLFRLMAGNGRQLGTFTSLQLWIIEAPMPQCQPACLLPARHSGHAARRRNKSILRTKTIPHPSIHPSSSY